MKVQCLITLAMLASAAFIFVDQYKSQDNTILEAMADESKMLQAFQKWQSEHGTSFADREEEGYRYSVFRENFQIVEEFNQQNSHQSMRLGMNVFAHLTNQEYRQKYLMTEMPAQEQESQQVEITDSNVSIADSINWTAKGAVAPVENQGQCGSCWAFSTKEALEGIYQIKSGNMKVLSAQQLVDCNTTNSGCGGGWPINAMQYTQQNGIEAESSYPYVSGSTGRATPCAYNANEVVFKNTASSFVKPNNNQNAILEAVQTQPLSILISASSAAFQLYSGGVMNSTTCGTAEDHAVLLTGYDMSAKTYSIKNSWGTGWGSSGYIYVAMTGDGPGICGVQQYVTYPSY